MGNKLRVSHLVMVPAVAIALSSCGYSAYNEAKEVAPRGDAFTVGLYEGYRALADGERYEEDWRDAVYFSEKAILAARGQTVLPQNPAEREIQDATVNQQYAALLSVLNGGARAEAPVLAAEAQTSFDCWLQELEEGHQPEDIAACRDSFAAAMQQLQAAPVQPQPPVEPAPMAPEPYKVYFPFDSAQVTAEGRNALREAVNEAQAYPNLPIVVMGHTDTSGSQQYNLGLSERRAQAVMALLRSAGIDTNRVTVGAVGEAQPAIATGDGVREPRNRRVEIRLVE